MWRFLILIGLTVTCTYNKNQSSSRALAISICQQQGISQSCLTSQDCTLAYGSDLGTGEEVAMECVHSFEAPENVSTISCYQSASGQKVIRSHPHTFTNWSEIPCTDEARKIFTGELCKVPSLPECPLNKGCVYYYARDTQNKEWVAIGCLKGGYTCGDSMTCFENEQKTRRLIAPQACQAFNEWKFVSCSPEDLKL